MRRQFAFSLVCDRSGGSHVTGHKELCLLYSYTCLYGIQHPSTNDCGRVQIHLISAQCPKIDIGLQYYFLTVHKQFHHG